MPFNVTKVTTASGDVNGTIEWVYTSVSGSISGRTSFPSSSSPAVTPVSNAPSVINTWLETNAGNTTAQLDAAIIANNTRASEVAAQATYDNDNGTFVIES